MSSANISTMTQGAAEALRAFHAYLHDASVQHVGAVAPLVKFESTTFAICACVVALLAMRFLFGRKASAMRLPPGPKGLPIVGNLFDMPRKTYWKTFTDWSEQYGDVVHLRILGRSVILLNSAESTTDLLENRTTIYSDRPKFPIMDMVGHHWNFGFMQYGKQWRELRRLFSTQYSSVKGLQMFYDSHRDSMSRLLLDVLKNPDAFVDHLRLRAGRLIIDVTYGIMIESVDDPLLKVAGDMMDVTSIGLSPPMWLANPAALMEFIPKWLGGSALSLKIQRWRADLEQFRTGAFAMCKERLNKGGSRPSYTASLLQEMSPSDGSHEEGMIRDTAALAYGAAFETSAASAEILILTMALNPEIQKRAQEEIDRVVGTHRLPDFSDREHLPYITAVMKEALRWHPPAPTGIPHQLKEDDTYNGFHLPAGSIVMGNIWSITHDEKRYPEPFAFKPERYLAADGSLDCTANDPARFVFGFGRRVCPGKFLAEDSLWLTTAQFLAVFDISFANPKSVPEIEWHSGAITRPYPVGYSIRPRSDAAKHLIECSVRE